MGGKAADIGAQSDIETLIGYIAREMAPAICSALNWQELHDAAAEHGLQVCRCGAGLVIDGPDLDLWAKYSSVGCGLSSKALTDRLGSFQPLQQQAEAKAARRRHELEPRRPDRPGTFALFAQCQREHQTTIAGRRHGFDTTRRDSALAGVQLRNWQQTQRILVKVVTRGAAERVMIATTEQQVDATHNANRQNANTKREVLFKQTAMSS